MREEIKGETNGGNETAEDFKLLLFSKEESERHARIELGVMNKRDAIVMKRLCIFDGNVFRVSGHLDRALGVMRVVIEERLVF